jgi:hypothetical protein
MSLDKLAECIEGGAWAVQSWLREHGGPPPPAARTATGHGRRASKQSHELVPLQPIELHPLSLTAPAA